MSQTNAEADPMFQLLTDALRAGPGSPEWHQALGRLRDQGATEQDEYKLLLSVREDLESGKGYRSIRAGPGFTQKLFEQIAKEEVPTKRRGLPTATLIAVVCGAVIVAILVVAGIMMIPRRTPEPPRDNAMVTELNQAYFPTEVTTAKFDGAIPTGWQTIGQLPLEAGKAGIKPVLSPEPTMQPIGGAVLAPEALPPDEPFAAEVKLRLNRPSEGVIVQIFVTADPVTDLSEDRATSANELVWQLRGSMQQVVLGVKGEAHQQAEIARPETPKSAKKADKSDTNSPSDMTVRIKISKDVAIVEANGQRIWAGPHDLPPEPRHVGVRFLRTAGAANAPKTHDPATVLSMQVTKK